MAKPKTPPTPTAPPTGSELERIVTAEELLERIPLDRSTIWRMCRDGRFPAPIQLTPSRIGWRWSAVLAWLDDREANPVEARLYYRRKKSARPTEAPEAAGR